MCNNVYFSENLCIEFSKMDMNLAMIQWVGFLIYFLGIIILIPSIITSVVFFILASKQKNLIKRKSQKKKAWVFLFVPFF